MQRAILFCLLSCLVGGAAAQPPNGYRVGAQPIPISPNHAVGAKIGQVRFLGMLVLPRINVGGQRLIDLSDLAWDEDEQVLYAISNKGALFALRPRIEHDRLVDVGVLRAMPLLDPDGRPLKRRLNDAEGMDILNGANGRSGDTRLILSFEGPARVMSFDTQGSPLHAHALPAPLNDEKRYAGRNRSLEALAIHPRYGILVAPEDPLRGSAPNESAIFSLAGTRWRYPLQDDASIVALKADGEDAVLVLERNFDLFGGTAIALRRFYLSGARAGRLDTLMALSGSEGFKLDNFEGLARHRGRRFFLVSDDNDAFYQKTLLLYIELLTDP